MQNSKDLVESFKSIAFVVEDEFLLFVKKFEKFSAHFVTFYHLARLVVITELGNTSVKIFDTLNEGLEHWSALSVDLLEVGTHLAALPQSLEADI